MRREQLPRQWRILGTIESRKHGATVAELADQEGCHRRSIWRDVAAIHSEFKSPTWEKTEHEHLRPT